jgi:tRNA (adenine37-N6)-methyltransferase
LFIERRRWILVVSYLHQTAERRMQVVPEGGTDPIGVFGSRAACRPNPVAVSRMELIGRDGLRLKVRQIDLLDGTPILDIKTYIDRRDGE